MIGSPGTKLGAPLDLQAASEIKGRLDPSEKIVWAGRPDPLVFAATANGVIPIIGIFFLGFSVFWLYGALSATRAAKGSIGLFAFFPLFGIPFVIAGLCMVLSPVWAWRRAKSTIYALTDRRAVIASDFPMRAMTSVEPMQLRPLEVHGGGGRRGTVYFFERPFGMNAAFGYTYAMRREGFRGIDEAERVAELIREHLLGARR
jgi:hypothetical protein